MPSDPEALAQLARLLGDETLRAASIDHVRTALASGVDRLSDGLIAEATASDDVTDSESALSFIDDRLRFFGDLLEPGQRSRLSDIVQAKIEAW